MSEHFSIEHATLQPTLVMRFHAPVTELAQKFGECYSTIFSHLAQRGEAAAGPPFAIYHNMDTRDLDVEAGFPVARVMEGDGQILPSSLPGGEVATTVHVGPYEGVGTTYDALLRSLNEAGWRISGSFWESYLNGPEDTPPSELRTRISVPIVAES